MDFTNKLVGSYRLLEHIGSGAYGKVYKAQHRVLPRIAAVKLLTAGSDSQEKREKFLREANFLETLRHKYILEVIDANIDEGGTAFIISKFASGGSLAERLQRAGGRLSAEITLRVLNQVGEALEHAHQQNVIHRDLKPGNILFDEDGNAVLSDFGIATTLADDYSLRHTAHVLGTPYYMAPEQISSMICREIDQYALGCVAYEMFTGRRVFDGQSHMEIYIKHTNAVPEPPSRYNSWLPSHIERAILRALAKRREDRHPSVAAFLRALNNQPNLLDDVPPTLDTLGFSLDNGQSAARPEPAPLFQPQQPPSTPRPAAPTPRVEPQPQPQAQKKQAAPAPKAPEPAIRDRAFEALNLANALETPPAPARETRRKNENPDPYIQRGRKLYTAQRYQEALDAFQKGVELVPRNASYQRWLGLAYQKVKQYPAALAALEKATQIEPGQAAHFSSLGELHEEMQNYEQAMIAFGEAARLSPSNADYRTSLEKARARFNQLQGKSSPKAKKQPAQPQSQAAQPPAQARSKEQPSPPAQVQAKPKEQRAAAQAQPKAQEQKQTPAAPAKQQPAQASKSGAGSLPDNAEKCFEQGTTLYSKEEYSRALVAFDRAVQLAPQNTTYLCAQGRAYLALGLHDDALATFSGAINAKPRHHEGYYWKAETLKAMGKPNEAEKVMATARSLSNAPKPASPPKQTPPSKPHTTNKNASQQSNSNRPASAGQPENQKNLFQRFIRNFFS